MRSPVTIAIGRLLFSTHIEITMSLKNGVKRLGSQLASLLHVYVRPQTSSRQVRDLVSRLVPHDLGLPLTRVGGEADGGYLLPDDFDGVRYCFSPGVGKKATFERDLYARGIHSFLADYSVDAPPAGLQDCDFEKKFVGAVAGEKVMTLDDWVARKCPYSSSGDLILQMDIEGAEYETLLATSLQTLSRFRMIVLEIHKLNHLSNKMYFHFVEAAMNKVLSLFEVAHIHGNNLAGLTALAGIDVPRVAEITFLRKDRVREKSPLIQLPNPLDRPNVPGKAELSLPEYWWNPGALERAA